MLVTCLSLLIYSYCSDSSLFAYCCILQSLTISFCRVTGIVRTTQQELNRAQRWSGRGGGGRGSGGSSGGMESGLHSLFILVQSAVCIKSSRSGRGTSASSSAVSNSSPYPSSLLTTRQKSSSDQHDSSASSSSSNHAQGAASSSNNGREYTRHELHTIRSIVTGTFHSPSTYTPPLSLLVASLCPAILGHELVKLGMLLGLVGGSPDTANTSSSSSNDSQSGGGVREAIHLLMVGEPGIGKSRLLKAASELSPRAVYVGGATSSTAGLTATVTRDSSSSNGRGDELCVEAGALVLADGGLCCVDELDKATADPHALLEAMEQQQVSLAKGGVVLSLRCRCAVFAACNPVHGRYNPRRSVVDNLGKQLTGPLLSRFDLVFLLLDQPDVDRDRRVSEHVAFGYQQQQQYDNMHSGSSNKRKRLDEEDDGDEDDEEGEDGQELRSLNERLRRAVRRVHKQHSHHSSSHHNQQGQQQPSYLLSTEQLRSYLSYARQYCQPVSLTADAARCLQRHYLRLRALSVEQGHLQQNTQPVTTRHLESLIRLCRARARLELRQEVTEKDAEDVVALYAEACDVASVDHQAAASSSAVGGVDSSGKKQRKTNGLGGQANRLLEALQHEAKHRAGQAMFKSQEIDEVAMKLGLDKGGANLVEVLRERGQLLLTGPRLFKLNV